MGKILALDLGSSQLKLLLMDENMRISGIVFEPYETLMPRPGWQIQNPEDWLLAMRRGMNKLKTQCGTDDIEVISLSGHMSGVVALGQEYEVLYPCIMLSDIRSQQECEEIEKRAGRLIRKCCANPVINAFSLPKLLWLKKREPDIYRRMSVWLSPKDYLRCFLTGKAATEYTDAYNAICVEPESHQWSCEILDAVGLEREKFPEIHIPMEKAGEVTEKAAKALGVKAGIPVVYGAADMACGAVGNGLFEEGDATLTLGTCATFLAMVPKTSEEVYGKVTFHMHVLPGKLYALGSHFNGGLAMNWISSILSEKGEVDYCLLRKLSGEAEQVPAGSRGVLTIPFLSGSGSPYYFANDRQTMLGVNNATTRAELFRSELEGITYNLKETLELFEQLFQNPLQKLVLGGGGVKIGLWPQMISDVFGRNVKLCEHADASTVGAALIGGHGVGMFDNLAEAAGKCLKIQQEFVPDAENESIYEGHYQRYLKTYELLKNYYRNE